MLDDWRLCLFFSINRINRGGRRERETTVTLFVILTGEFENNLLEYLIFYFQVSFILKLELTPIFSRKTNRTRKSHQLSLFCFQWAFDWKFQFHFVFASSGENEKRTNERTEIWQREKIAERLDWGETFGTGRIDWNDFSFLPLFGAPLTPWRLRAFCPTK